MPRAPVAPVARDLVVARVFAALAHPTRLALLRALAADPRPLSALRAAALQERADLPPLRSMSRQALQGHLRRLVDSGLVRTAERGRTRPTRYRAVEERLLWAACELARYAAGDARPGCATRRSARVP